MTPAEALAVVREALPYSLEDAEEFQMPKTLAGYAALVLIEERVAELEAARDGAMLAIETWEKREQKQYERVRELEAALREISQLGDERTSSYEEMAAYDEARAIARRALGGGEE